MKRRISRLVKKLLVYSRLDKWIADQFQKSELHLLKRLIPDRTFYKPTDTRRVLRKGAFFEVHPADFSQWLLFAGDNFEHVEAALKVLAPDPEGLILDIGANCGHFSMVLAQKISERKWKNQIISFEPNPRIFALLEKNLKINPDLDNIIHLVNKGVGKEKGVLQLQIPIRNSGAASLVKNYEHEPHEKHEIEKHAKQNIQFLG